MSHYPRSRLFRAYESKKKPFPRSRLFKSEISTQFRSITVSQLFATASAATASATAAKAATATSNDWSEVEGFDMDFSIPLVL
jgi:hypothetical protein